MLPRRPHHARRRPPGDAVVYAFAATAGSGAQKDLYRSTNGGSTFTPARLPTKTPVNPNEEQPDMNIMLGQAFYNHMVLVDPSDPSRNTVYIGGQLASAKSTDGGASWRLISNWLAQYSCRTSTPIITRPPSRRSRASRSSVRDRRRPLTSDEAARRSAARRTTACRRI